MKNFIYVNLLLLLLFSNCSKEEISHQSDYDKSFAAFQNFKISSNGNYDYQTEWGSWTGIAGTTTIYVRNNKVIRRDYIVNYPTTMQVPDSIRTKNTWSEVNPDLNTHLNSGAFDPVIFDSIYIRAKNNWLQKDSQKDNYFEVDSLGLIKSCGYIPKGCADDCFNGVNISFIKSR